MIWHLRYSVTALAGAVLTVGSTACTDDTGPKLIVPVTGTVFHDGKPLVGALVTFIKDGAPRVSAGETDENGHFVLSADRFNPIDGAYVGKNRVSVTMGIETIRIEDGKVMEEGFQPRHPMEAATMYKGVKKAAVDAKYGNHETSGIYFFVTDRFENHFKIVLD